MTKFSNLEKNFGLNSASRRAVITMESRYHLSNGVSPKDQTSRGNKIKGVFLILVAMISFGFNSCKTLDMATLSPKVKNENLLPPLNSVLDVESFGSVFGLTKTIGYGSFGGASKNIGRGYAIGYGTTSMKSTTYSNPILNDIEVIFNRDVENICNLLGTPKGSMKCRVIVGEEKIYGGAGWAVLSGFTLCIPNLFGMPIASPKGNLQIEVTIFDNNNSVVGKYTSDFHKQKTYVALYWGYSYNNSMKRNARLIFIGCMEDIKRQIAKDYDRLVKALQ